jgi:C4-type Zn-finger protein
MEDELIKLEGQLKCPLCKNTLYDPAILVCGHLFCYDCICYGIEFGVRDVFVVAEATSAASCAGYDDDTSQKVLSTSSSSSPATSSKLGRNKKAASATSTDVVSPSPGKKRPRAKTFMCPVCEQPAYKWTVNKVPQLQNFLEVLRGASCLAAATKRE